MITTHTITRRPARRAGVAAAIAVVSLAVAAPACADSHASTIAGPGSGSRAQSGSETESGSASALGLRARIGDSIDISEAGAAYPEGGEDKLASVSLGTVGAARTVTAAASGTRDTGETAAEAGVEELELHLTELMMRGLTSDEVRATCLARPGAEPSGAAHLDNAILTLPGLPDIALEPEPAPNTTIRLPGGLGQAVMNEQNTQPDGSLTVNALHLRLNDPMGTYSGELIVGSVNCLAGTADEAEIGARNEDRKEDRSRDRSRDRSMDRNKADDPVADSAEDASIVGAAEDARTGRAVRGVALEIVEQDGSVAGGCTTNGTGTCAAEGLRPGTYYACVADVPRRYVMPDRNDVCSGPHKTEAGEEVRADRPFGIERSESA